MDNTDIEIKLILKLSEVNIVLAGLQEIAARLSNPLSENIRKQATPQLPGNEQQENLDKLLDEQLDK